MHAFSYVTILFVIRPISVFTENGLNIGRIFPPVPLNVHADSRIVQVFLYYPINVFCQYFLGVYLFRQ